MSYSIYRLNEPYKNITSGGDVFYMWFVEYDPDQNRYEIKVNGHKNDHVFHVNYTFDELADYLNKQYWMISLFGERDVKPFNKGDIVRVKTREEILSTLNDDWYGPAKTYFNTEMYAYCKGIYRVKYCEKQLLLSGCNVFLEALDSKTGDMISMGDVEYWLWEDSWLELSKESINVSLEDDLFVI